MPTAGAAVNKDPRDRINSSASKLHLICIPQAGMGAWAFHGWQASFPPTVEVLPVELPGRNSRMMEPKPETMADLVKGLYEGLTAYGAFTKPFIIIGHSLGAWVAYELVAELLRRGESAPKLLLVSGARAPHLSALEHDCDRTMPAIAKLSDDDFWTHFKRRYGVNPDLEHASTAQFVLPLLRADFGIVESVRAPTRRSYPPATRSVPPRAHASRPCVRVCVCVCARVYV